MFDKKDSPEDRLSRFRTLRQTPDLDAQKIVRAFCHMEPMPRYLDFYTPSSWPNVFEIVSEGYFCQSGITLMITSLLVYAQVLNEPQIKLFALNNNINGNQGLVLEHQEQAYNFLPGEIVSVNHALENSVVMDTHIIRPDNLFH